MCFLFLGSSIGVIHFLAPEEYSHLIPLPAWHDIVTWGPTLAASACLAFVLNVVVAFFIKNSSAVAFILAGIVKDATIVSFGAVFFHEYISILQVFGFACQLFGIL